MKKLLIVFVKNKRLGHVKTRLAKTIGNEKALIVYQELLDITKTAISEIEVDKCVYFSEEVEVEGWINFDKQIQNGENLGEKMQNAFVNGFNNGYQSIVLIGSDLPDISSTLINEAFEQLTSNEVVLGPAEDGGYYLIGLSKINTTIFKNKPWSTNELLNTTLEELQQNNINYSLLKNLNDIDDYEDLVASTIYKNINI